MKQKILAFASLLSVGTIASAQQINGTFAIQNVQTGKDLRPFEARKDNGNRIVLYDHHSWKCVTWTVLPVEGNIYRLTNFYALKALQPSSTPKPGVTLQQQPANEHDLQLWEFIRQPADTYLIRHKASGLYITISSIETNSSVLLMPKIGCNAQHWRLIGQRPWF